MQDKSHTSGILDNKNAFNAVNHHAILFSSWRPIVFQLQSPAYIDLFCRLYFGSFWSKVPMPVSPSGVSGIYK